MRRVFAAAVLTVLALAALPAAAEAPQQKEQKVAGRVTAPTPSNAPGIPRRVFLVSRATNGVNGWAFDVDPATIGGSFALKRTANPTGDVNLNIIFYSDPGDVGATAPTAAGQFQSSRADGGERGFVPEDSKVAMVWMEAGAGASFEYVATSPPVVTLAEGAALDLTVPAGATVRFHNATAEAAFVRHLPAEGEFVAFTSDPDGIAPDGVFTALLDFAGTYAYETSVGTGTITVTE
jgi:hypothetical protein